MNRHSYLRLAPPILAVAAALGLGLAARALLPPRHEAMRAHSPATVEGAAPPAAAAEAPPLFEDGPARSLAAADAGELDRLRERLSGLRRHGNPVREAMTLRTELLAGITGAEDFLKAMELLEASGADVEFRWEAALALAKRMAETDPAAAADAVALVRDRHLGSSAMRGVMETWAGRDPEAALAFLRTRDTGVKAQSLHAVFQELAKRDPAAAMARVGEFNEPGFNHNLGPTVMSEWWVRDPAGAARWVRSRNDAERPAAMRTLLEVAGNRDPAGAWKMFQSLPAAEKPDSAALFQLFYMWSFKDPSAALDAVLTEPDGAPRGDLLRQLGRSVRMADEGSPGEAKSDKFLERMTDGPARQEVLYGMVDGHIHDGSARDYRRAAALTDQITDGGRRQEFMKAIGGGWAKDDAPSASEWLDKLPNGADRDAAIGEFVRGSFDKDPAAALTWSAAITDEGKRGRRLTELYPRWEAADPPAAAAWLEGQSNAVRAAVAAKPQP